MSRISSHVAVIVILMLATLSGASGAPRPAHAATAQVTNCSDTGAGTLRDLIGTAAAGDTITFACSGTITLGNAGTLHLNQNLTIDGSGQAVTISGGSARSLFSIDQTSGGAGVSVTLRALTMVNGTDVGGLAAITVLPLNTLTIINSTVSANHALQNAGAIFNDGTLTIINSTVSGNSSTFSAGAIFNTGTLTIANSTFSGNSSSFSSTSSSGAIYNGGTLSITNGTFSGNSGPFAGTGAVLNVGVATLTNTILGGNSGLACETILGGTLTDGGSNLADDIGCAFTQSSSVNNSTNLNLGPLADNGGGGQTVALLPGSVAIDIAGCLQSTDQRGYPRPDAGESRCDSGAFESGNPLPTPTTTRTPTTTPVPPTQTPTSTPTRTPLPPTSTLTPAPGSVTTCDENTLRSAIAQEQAGGTVQFGCSGTITLSVAGGPITIAQNLTLDGNGQAVTISGGNAVELFVVNTGVSFVAQRLTLVNGRSTNGGAIYNNGGTVTVANSTVSGNAAVANGQGIFNGDGGAIYNNGGTVTVANSTVNGNATVGSFSGDTGFGGAIFNISGALHVINSSVSGNAATRGGGGIELWTGTATLANTILAANSGNNCGTVPAAFQDGGGTLRMGPAVASPVGPASPPLTLNWPRWPTTAAPPRPSPCTPAAQRSAAGWRPPVARPR